MNDTQNLYLFGYCEYTGTPDLYPKKYRDLINNNNIDNMAIKIQRWWKRQMRKQMRKQVYKLRSEKTKDNYMPERFPSWF